MIAGVRLCDGSVLTALLPVELAGVNNNTAERCSVTADELCCGVNNDVCTVLNRSYEVWCCKCIVNDERKLVCCLLYTSDAADE